MAHALARGRRRGSSARRTAVVHRPAAAAELRKLLGPDRAHLIERAAQVVSAPLRDQRRRARRPSIPASMRCCDRIRSSGPRVFLATTKFVDHAEKVLIAFSLRDHFEGVFGARHDGSMADKRELLGHIIETTGIDPARSVMIGDREHDIVGAKANGIASDRGDLWLRLARRIGERRRRRHLRLARGNPRADSVNERPQTSHSYSLDRMVTLFGEEPS